MLEHAARLMIGAAKRRISLPLLIATTRNLPASSTRDTSSRPYASTSSDDLAQQVIDYARALVADEQKKEQQGAAAVADARRRALDALRAVSPALAAAGRPAPRCAVLLAASDAHASLGEWVEASKEAAEALEFAAAADPAAAESLPLLQTAALAAVRAALAAGDDAAAARAAARAGGVGDVLAGLAALARGAGGQGDGRGEGQFGAAQQQQQPPSSSDPTTASPLALLSLGRTHAAAAMRAAAWAAAAQAQAGGDGDARAAAAAAAAGPHADAARGPLGRCAELADAEADSAASAVPLVPHLSASLWREVAADARVAQGQAAAAARRWPEAEEALSAAVRAGEAAAGGDARAPSLAAPLVLLGDVYARTARVTFAEGMYREAARLAGAEARIGGGAGGGAAGAGAGGAGGGAGDGGGGAPTSGENGGGGGGTTESLSTPAAGAGAAGPRPVHPSLAALAAWRYAQLLTALPRRGTEAAAWAAAGERHWRQQQRQRAAAAASPAAAAAAPASAGEVGGGDVGQGGPADALGALDCRTGRSLSREGGCVSLLCRRLFLVGPASASATPSPFCAPPPVYGEV